MGSQHSCQPPLHPCQLTWLRDSTLLDALSQVDLSTFGCLLLLSSTLLDNSVNKLKLQTKLMSTTHISAHARRTLKVFKNLWPSQDNRLRSSLHVQSLDQQDKQLLRMAKQNKFTCSTSLIPERYPALCFVHLR